MNIHTRSRFLLKLLHKDALACLDFIKDNESWGYHYSHAVNKFSQPTVDYIVKKGLAEQSDTSAGIIIGDYRPTFKALALTKTGDRAALSSRDRLSRAASASKYGAEIIIGLFVSLVSSTLFFLIAG